MARIFHVHQHPERGNFLDMGMVIPARCRIDSYVQWDN